MKVALIPLPHQPLFLNEGPTRKLIPGSDNYDARERICQLPGYTLLGTRQMAAKVMKAVHAVQEWIPEYL
jgi:hypothetical protein